MITENGQINPNAAAEMMRKTMSLLQKDLPAQLEKMQQAINDSGAEKVIDIKIDSVDVQIQVAKSGQVIILPKDKRVVEEIIKRLQNDRHTQ